MITWMQKHRKYLVITIWISTIAFVGAGFVGWGTYQYGKKSHNVAMVGDVPISVDEFQQAYRNAYQKYNQMLGGRLDEATAKKLGLRKQVLNSLIYQALIENFAQKHGIVVSDEEVQQAILAIPAFRKNGHFDKATYIAMLQNMQMKPKTFEASLKKDLLIQKSLALLSPDAIPVEVESLGAALFIADKLRFKIFNADEIEVNVDEAALKKYWEAHKNDYMTPRRYKVAVTWIGPANYQPSDAEIAAWYQSHRTDYTDAKGEILPLEKVRNRIADEIRLKKAKRKAELAYIAMKKGKEAPQQEIVVDEGDKRFSPTLWKAIRGAAQGSVLKPKISDNRYAVVKVEKVIEPKPEDFKTAYDAVKKDYIAMQKRQRLTEMAQKASKDLKDGTLTGFVTRDSIDALSPLMPQEAGEFLKQLFSSDKTHGAVLLGDKAVAYTIVEQKLLKNDKLKQHEAVVKQNAKKIKSQLIQNNLLARLQQEYPIQIFIKESE